MIYSTSVALDERFNLPLTGPANYRVRDNIIYTQSIEINAVRHCNLSCRSCSHASPISSKLNMDPNVVGRDLKTLSRFLRCEAVRILGGEPLLHPSLEELLKAVKYSNISTNICLATNGTLLQLINDKLIPYIDEVQISLYPLKKQQMDIIKKEAIRLSERGIRIELKEISYFRESLAQNPTRNSSIIKMVYETCMVAHLWRSLTVNNGYLYRCPQSLVYAEYNSNYDDSLSIGDIKCINDLLKFLENNNACKACSQCLGSIGKQFPHEQVKNDCWQIRLPVTPEEGLDFDYAKSL